MSALKGAKINDDDLAYIVYLADNIAAFSDRRKKDEGEEKGFDLSVPLQSVFNILNGNHKTFIIIREIWMTMGKLIILLLRKQHFRKNFI